MYIESVPNRGSPPAVLLRESFREDGRVRKRTLANLSAWPTQLVEGFRTLLKGGLAVAADGIRARRALPHGHAAAVLGTMRAIGLDRLLGKPADKRLVPLAIALIAGRLISSHPPPSSPPRANWLPTPPPRAWADSSGLARSTRSSSTAPSTGSAHARARSRLRSPAATSRTGRWCSTTSLRPGLRVSAASWHASAILETARRANYKSSMACCVPPMAVRWRSRSLKAIPPTR